MAENESLREHLHGVVALAFLSEVPVVDLEEAIREATDFQVGILTMVMAVAIQKIWSRLLLL